MCMYQYSYNIVKSSLLLTYKILKISMRVKTKINQKKTQKIHSEYKFKYRIIRNKMVILIKVKL